jgi:hypothetical protein
MKSIFNLIILYEKRSLEVTVQCLSIENPFLYAVWPKDETLKNSFDDTYVLFTQNYDKSDGKLSITWSKVHYSKNVKTTNLNFEMAVWDELSKLENINNLNL